MIMYHWVFVLNANNEGGLYFIHYQKQCVLISIVSTSTTKSPLLLLIGFSSLANCMRPLFKNKTAFIIGSQRQEYSSIMQYDISNKILCTFSNIPQNLSQFTSLWRYNSINQWVMEKMTTITISLQRNMFMFWCEIVELLP